MKKDTVATPSSSRSLVDTSAVVLAGVMLGIGAAVILSTPAPSLAHPYPDAPSYVELSQRLAGLDGYSVTLEGEPAGSRYPPGFPVLLAVLSPLAGPATATAILSIGFLGAVGWSASKAGGPIASLIALAIVTMGIAKHRVVGDVMADLPAAAALMLSLLAFQYGRPRLAGWIAGFGVWIRVAHIAVAAALPRRSWSGFLVGLAGLALTRLVWGWGYEANHAQWALSHMWSGAELLPGTAFAGNASYYAMVLLGVGDAALVPPGALLLAAWAVWPRPERRLVVVTVLGLLGVYLPYFYQDSRFMIGVAAFIAVYCGVGVSELAMRLRVAGAPGDGDVTVRERIRPASIGSGYLLGDERDA